jgi:hypothetical protein
MTGAFSTAYSPAYDTPAATLPPAYIPPEWVVLPDVELLVCTALTTALPLVGFGPIHVGTQIPNPRPDSFVRVIRAGGTKESLVSEQAWVIVEAYAPMERDASYLLSICRAILHAQDGPLFGAFEVSGPVNLPDPTTSQVRYTQTLGIRARGNSVTPTTAP